MIWETPDLFDLSEQLKNLQQEKCPAALDIINWQKGLKQVFMRTDWSKDALYAMFGAVLRYKNLHAHMDPAGFEFLCIWKSTL